MQAIELPAIVIFLSGILVGGLLGVVCMLSYALSYNGRGDDSHDWMMGDEAANPEEVRNVYERPGA